VFLVDNGYRFCCRCLSIYKRSLYDRVTSLWYLSLPMKDTRNRGASTLLFDCCPIVPHVPPHLGSGGLSIFSKMSFSWIQIPWPFVGYSVRDPISRREILGPQPPERFPKKLQCRILHPSFLLGFEYRGTARLQETERWQMTSTVVSFLEATQFARLDPSCGHAA
jgi:hypothetical protein